MTEKPEKYSAVTTAKKAGSAAAVAGSPAVVIYAIIDLFDVEMTGKQVAALCTLASIGFPFAVKWYTNWKKNKKKGAE